MSEVVMDYKDYVSRWTIWKFPLISHGARLLWMPEQARNFRVGVIDGCPFLWAEVYDRGGPDQRMIARTFSSFFTGDPIPEHPGQLLGTLVLDQNIVTHIYQF